MVAVRCGRHLQEGMMQNSGILRELGEDVAYYAGALIHRAFDLTCLLALGLLVYVSGIDSANADQHRRPIFGIQASIAGTPGLAVTSSHAPTACNLTLDLFNSPHHSCIQSMILDPIGT